MHIAKNAKRGRMQTMKKVMLVLALFLVSGVAYAQGSYMDPSYGSAIEAGYARGFQHGLRDRQAGAGYDYSHSSDFRLGSRSYRIGYQRGYDEGYYRGWSRNNRYYSYQGRDNRYGNRYGYGYGSRYGNERAAVTLFEDDGFRGRAIGLDVGGYPYLAGDWDDRIDSLVLNDDVRVILFDERNFRGRRVVIDGDVRDLDRFGFGDKAASMIIEPRRSGGYDRFDRYDSYK